MKKEHLEILKQAAYELGVEASKNLPEDSRLEKEAFIGTLGLLGLGGLAGAKGAKAFGRSAKNLAQKPTGSIWNDIMAQFDPEVARSLKAKQKFTEEALEGVNRRARESGKSFADEAEQYVHKARDHRDVEELFKGMTGKDLDRSSMLGLRDALAEMKFSLGQTGKYKPGKGLEGMSEAIGKIKAEKAPTFTEYLSRQNPYALAGGAGAGAGLLGYLAGGQRDDSDSKYPVIHKY